MASGNVNRCGHYGKQYEAPQEQSYHMTQQPLFWVCPEKFENIYLQRYVHRYVHCSIIHGVQDL